MNRGTIYAWMILLSCSTIVLNVKLLLSMFDLCCCLRLLFTLPGLDWAFDVVVWLHEQTLMPTTTPDLFTMHWLMQ